MVLAKYYRTLEAATKAALAHAARRPRWVYAVVPEGNHYRVVRHAPGDTLDELPPPKNVSPETWGWLLGVISDPPPCARRELQSFIESGARVPRRYSAEEIVESMDSTVPAPAEEVAWLNDKPVGREII
jgi:hypothetical protein